MPSIAVCNWSNPEPISRIIQPSTFPFMPSHPSIQTKPNKINKNGYKKSPPENTRQKKKRSLRGQKSQKQMTRKLSWAAFYRIVHWGKCLSVKGSVEASGQSQQKANSCSVKESTIYLLGFFYFFSIFHLYRLYTIHIIVSFVSSKHFGFEIDLLWFIDEFLVANWLIG